MAASSSYCLAWRGAAMAFSYPPSSPSPLIFCVATPHRLPSTPPLPCLSFRFRTRAGKGLKQEKETYMEIEAIQGEQEKVGEVESMDGNGDGSSLKDSEAPSESIVDSAKSIESYSETLVDSTKTLAVDSETLVVSAKTLEADCETLVDSVKTLVVDSRTLVAPSETLKVASETLEVASETLESASKTLVADSETLADTASALNAASESARNGKPQTALPVKDQPQTTSLSMNGDKFEDARWKNGTWDLEMFKKDGEISWDDVIDAEILRRKWLQDRPESTNNDEPVVFESSVIPWWAWVKRFHLPEAELLNGRAAMIGFFMAYLVDSLTGVGLVDQMSSFFGKLLLFITVVGVMAIRKNEDAETITKFVKEWSFYDKQWQATWQEDPPSSEKKE